MATTTETHSPTLHAADSHDLIRVQGARVNNLKDVNVELPKRRLTVFTGVSGSGKSSLVFGTIAAESQRLINETYSAFVQGFMPTLARPDVDLLDGLTTAIIVDQERMGADPRSTVGTATDANALLRILFSRLGEPHIGSPQAFSFNVAVRRARAGRSRSRRAAGPRTEKATFHRARAACALAARAGAPSTTSTSRRSTTTSKSLTEGALTIPGYSMDGLVRPASSTAPASSTRTSRSSEFTKKRAARPALRGAHQDQGRGHQPHLRGAHPDDPEVDARPRTSRRCSRTSGPSSSGP